MSLNVSLTKELEVFVGQQVNSGMYQTASEVVREGLRRLKQEDEMRQIRLEELRRELAKGDADLAAGRVLSGTPQELASHIKTNAAKKLRERAGQ